MEYLLASMQRAVATGSAWLLPLAFVAGLCTSLNPCVYPTLPAIAGYVSGHVAGHEGRRGAWRGLLLGLTFLAGLGMVYALLGALVGSFVGKVLGLTRGQWLMLVGGVCILAGLVMARVLPLHSWSWAPLQAQWRRMRGFPGALALGALFGVVATPCATPPLVVIMSAAAAEGKGLFGALLLFAYALGHGFTMIVVAVSAAAVAGLGRLSRYAQAMQLAGGWMLIGVGLYLLWTA
jgi:cytochrome c-type biogenesis protein